MSLKIFYIFTGVLPNKTNQEIYERNIREQYIVKYSQNIGYISRLIFLTYDRQIKSISNDYNDVKFFPVDDSNCHFAGKHTSKALLKYIENEKPDLIVFKGMGNLLSRWLINKSRHMFRCAFIVGGKTKDIYSSFADYILAEHNIQIERYFKKKLKKSKVDILPKLLNEEDFQLNNSIEKEYDIVSVGRITEHKNHLALVPFFKDYKVAIIGDGPNYSEIKSIAVKYPNNVYMPGNLPRSKVLDIISKSKLNVHPCKWENGLEGLPRVIAESFACKVPVVVLRNTIPSGFMHGRHGLMVNVDEFEYSVHKLLSDAEKLSEMGREAYLFAKSNFTHEAVNNTINKMYERIFAQGSNARNKLKIIIEKTYYLTYYLIISFLIKIKKKTLRTINNLSRK